MHLEMLSVKWQPFCLSLNVLSNGLFPYLLAHSLAHYIDVIMTTVASQITSLTVVCLTVYSDADQRKHQSSASLAFVWGIHRDRWIPRTKGQLRGKCFHLMTSSCIMWMPPIINMLNWIAANSQNLLIINYSVLTINISCLFVQMNFTNAR